MRYDSVCFSGVCNAAAHRYQIHHISTYRITVQYLILLLTVPQLIEKERERE